MGLDLKAGLRLGEVKAQHLDLTGSLFGVASLDSTGNISGLNVYSQGSGTFARINNANGLITSIYLESGATTRSAGTYGGRIEVGNLLTSAGSAATITFTNAFNVGSYAIFFSLAAGTANGSVNAYTSGALRASGCEVIGAASASYNWLAVGL